MNAAISRPVRHLLRLKGMTIAAGRFLPQFAEADRVSHDRDGCPCATCTPRCRAYDLEAGSQHVRQEGPCVTLRLAYITYIAYSE